MAPTGGGKPLKVLVVEDSPEDAEILVREIRKAGYLPQATVVSDRESFVRCIDSGGWDIIFSDFVLPSFGGMDALAIVRERGLEIPFVIVSGRIGEETAVEAMRGGASDYLLKGKLSRLGRVIERELGEQRLREEKRKTERELLLLKKTIDSLPLGITIASLDRTILYVNREEARMHGYETEELVGNSVRIFAPETSWMDVPLDRLPGESTRRRESVNVRNDGSLFPVHVVSTVLTDADGTPTAIVTCSEDITERKAMEMTLRRQMAAIESAMDGILIIDRDGTLSYVNRSSARICGWNHAGDLIGRSWRVLFDGRQIRRMEREIASSIKRTGYWHGELAGMRKNGEPFTMELSVTRVEGNGYVGVFRDVTHRKETEQRLSFLSTHDPLTGFFNRLHFEGELQRLDKSRIHPISVVMADVDGLKEVNDTLGHQTGDCMLRSAARAIASAFRTEDLIARIGGDEFVVILPGTILDAAERSVVRIRQKIDEINREGNRYLLSLSIGCAATSEGMSLRAALRRADELMYRDKRHRRTAR